MILRAYLAKPHGPRGVGATVVEEPELRELAAAGVLEPRLELVTPQPGAEQDDVDALFAELFPAPPDPPEET